jgi:threonine/homoserine/homoserine lactone efflux protein
MRVSGISRDKDMETCGKTRFTAPGRRNSLDIVWKGILINILNPKLTLFFISFLAVHTAGVETRRRTMVVLSGIFMLMTMSVRRYGILASTASSVSGKAPLS